MAQIDLTPFAEKVNNLSGKDRGLAARAEHALDRLDSQDSVQIEVIIPANVYSISTSFFCGLFGDSYKALGYAGLKSKYHFVIPEEMQNQIEQGLDRCASEFRPLL